MAHIGTILFSRLNGEHVGTDSFGNRYYRARNRKLDRYGRERRWVIFKGTVEASKVPAEWHAWLHHTVEISTADDSDKRPWQREHLPNLTGTAYAYRPKGHDLHGSKRSSATGDYEAWSPE
ncbi:MAG: NADH:ubiquinone oxidoreductase subunit NDUFA12 [Rhodospirillales bacterium]|nr:NADH:ubiquinone oxidoreductase subunit NDUFA12 [Rhodospirillales bacterium]